VIQPTHTDGANTSSKTRSVAALVLVALLGLISAGCGSRAPSETSSANGTAANTGTNAGVSGQDKTVKFAECMRANGVPHFPDANAKGEFVFGIDVTPAVWARAVNACKALQPPGTLSAKRTPQQQTASLRFAQCMRENGVKDFPDPANGEPLINTYRIPSSATSGGMSILNAAIHKCHGVLAEAAAGQ
jgi:hypothetical protein